MGVCAPSLEAAGAGQVLHQQRAVQVTEILQVVLVPAEGVGDVMLLGIVQEQVADGGDEERFGLGSFPDPLAISL